MLYSPQWWLYSEMQERFGGFSIDEASRCVVIILIIFIIVMIVILSISNVITLIVIIVIIGGQSKRP